VGVRFLFYVFVLVLDVLDGGQRGILSTHE